MYTKEVNTIKRNLNKISDSLENCICDNAKTQSEFSNFSEASGDCLNSNSNTISKDKTFQIQLRVSGQAAELIYMHISVSMENSFGFEPAIPYKGAKINIHWLLNSNSSTEKNGY